MITPDEAERIAGKWVRDSTPAGLTLTTIVTEFDLGYVVSARPGPGQPPLFGAGRGIIDKETGELSTWPALPVESIISRYRARRASRPQRVWTWHPADQARWDLGHVATPTAVSHLRLPAASEPVSARIVQGPHEPVHHPLVVDFLHRQLAAGHREPGYARCSEAAAVSDTLHREDAVRRARGAPGIGLEEARAGLFRGASMRTYRVREPRDPDGGTLAPPCASCARLTRHFGIAVQLPDGGGQ